VTDTAIHPALVWFEVLEASAANGRDLLDEARLLRDELVSPRALALAVLAAEEFGKAIRAFVVLNSGGDPDEVADFNRVYRQHQPKLEAGKLWAWMLGDAVVLVPELSEELTAQARRSAGRKMDSLYVDRRPDGALLSPRASITESDIAVAIDAAEVLCRSVTQVAALLDSDDKVLQFWSIGPQVSAALTETFEHDPAQREEFVQTLRAVISELGLGSGARSAPVAGHTMRSR
jgi:AbiV family abortive infection protein